LTPHHDRKKVLVVSVKREAEPVLGQLRAAGHQVSLVEGMDEAQTLLASGGFDQSLLPARALELLLEERAFWQGTDTEAWRISTAGIAHDLRSLLRALEWSIRELTEADVDGMKTGGDLPQLTRTIAVLSAFLRELTSELEGDAQQGLSLSAINLEDVVESAAMAVYPSALERRQRLVIDIHDEVAQIQADATKMKRVLTNLLDHASRQSPSLATVRVGAQRENDSCVISISYVGNAITLSELRRLFSPATPMVHSAGGGLSRSQRLIEEHGGRLWVESQKGSGTCIFVSLPQPGTVTRENAGALTRTRR
jgi:K+-sensing histidine kinase KdpD